MKNNFLIIILLISFTANAQETPMSESERSVFVKNITAETQKIQSLTTDFVQYKHMDFLSKDIETSGKMAFRSPNMLNWQYTEPYRYRLIFKDKKVFIDDQGKKSSVNAGGKIFENINTLIIGSVSGDMFDEQQFDIRFYKTNTHHIAKLKPKNDAMKKYIRQISLYFPKNEQSVSEVKLTEPSGDYTRIVFKNKKINAPVNDADFIL
ncbi:MAG: outer membrane lipoprotein carrier protein LolA [Capnocytophaga sp.]|nr:outer membrane lipoprotein carrier protein LolA [Capnocytophaga sp.]